MRRFYARKRVLVTGGLGFIGSNLALRLEQLGASVTVVDSLVPGCGANPHNLEAGAGSIRVQKLDIGAPEVAPSVAESQIVFNLAGEVSHTHSMQMPERDLELNSTAHLRFLRICARVRPGLRVVYAGTRQVYGVPQSLPVDEGHPTAPVDFNGVHKAAASQYHLMLTRLGQVDAVVLRLTNVYGPRMAIRLGCQGFLPVFTRNAISGTPIEIFGNGTQLRDPIYVEDACDAFLRAGMVADPVQRTLNVGSAQHHSVGEIAEEFTRQAGLPAPSLRPFPPERKSIDIGSYYTCPAACRDELGWHSATNLHEGVGATLAYFRAHRQHYQQACPLGHLRHVQRAS